MQNQMEERFFELKQDNLSVAEYERKFTELARFVPEYVNTDVKRAKRFQQGLKSWIRSKVAMFQLKTYAEVVQKAMIIEGESEHTQKEKENKKRKQIVQEGSQNFGYKRQGSSQSGSTSSPRSSMGSVNQGRLNQNFNQQRTQKHSMPECSICKRKHLGSCNKPNITCFKCNQKGHYSNECKNQKQSSNQKMGVTCFKCGKSGRIAKDCRVQVAGSSRMNAVGASSANKPKERTFNMRMKDSIQNEDVVAGMLSINSIPAKVLIDSGATKSFVSLNFVGELQNKVQPLEEALIIETANQDRVLVNQVYPNCKMEIVGHRFSANLIPFRLGEFDVILGMDWLTNYESQIDCKRKKVVLMSSDKEPVIFQGQKQVKKFLSIAKAKKLLRQGCEAYLAHVVDARKEIPKIEDIPIVRDFPDVFPDDLPGLPPNREIEFC